LALEERRGREKKKQRGREALTAVGATRENPRKSGQLKGGNRRKRADGVMELEKVVEAPVSGGGNLDLLGRLREWAIFGVFEIPFAGRWKRQRKGGLEEGDQCSIPAFLPKCECGK